MRRLEQSYDAGDVIRASPGVPLNAQPSFGLQSTWKAFMTLNLRQPMTFELWHLSGDGKLVDAFAPKKLQVQFATRPVGFWEPGLPALEDGGPPAAPPGVPELSNAQIVALLEKRRNFDPNAGHGGEKSASGDAPGAADAAPPAREKGEEDYVLDHYAP